MSEDAYGNKVYKCDECSVSFIEGFDEERDLCDECAASIDEEGRQENIGVESLQEVLVAAKEEYHTKEVW
jgi:hypothetical protein